MHKHGTDWTYKDKKILHALWHRRTQGESTAELAEVLELTPSGLLDLWRKLGYKPDFEQRRQKAEAYETRKVYHFRLEGLTFSEILTRLGRDPTEANQRALRAHLKTWCRYHQLVYPKTGHSIDESAEQLYRWRSQGVLYRECAERLGMEPTESVINRLTNRLSWWCKKNGKEYPKQNIWRSADELEKLYELRAKSTTWRECAEALGVEFTSKWRGRMTARLTRYAKREGKPWPLHAPAVPPKAKSG